MLKKIGFIALLGLSLPLNVLAGSEDWSGVYQIKMSDNSIQKLVHTPTNIQFFFFQVGSCLSLAKGAKINGVEITNNVKFCTRDAIPTLTAEVEKLGTIVSKTITVGPSYTEN